jgi:ABC-2 type transport system ATP-binding protein
VITAAADQEATVQVVSRIAGVLRTEILSPTDADTTELLIESEKELDVRRTVFETFCRHGVPLLGIRAKNATLEEMFLALTSTPGQANS